MKSFTHTFKAGGNTFNVVLVTPDNRVFRVRNVAESDLDWMRRNAKIMYVGNRRVK